MMMNLDSRKKIQRERAIKKRFLINQSFQKKIAKFNDDFFKIKWFEDGKIIASFLSIKTEISTDYLNEYILQKNKILCLPIIKEQSEILIFREYKSGNNLVSGKFGIMEPDIFSQELLPDIIFTPCLTFDMKGYRLGYGGGYYDKTFAHYKKLHHSFITVAVAYDDQKVIEVAHDKFDQKIDYILTEKELYKIS